MARPLASGGSGPRDRSTSFLNPVPSGTIGRTDQGVDISAAPGSRVVDPVPGFSKAIGTIKNWYLGQPYQWFKVLTGRFKGQYWYGAEQFQSSVPTGGVVGQGQQIGTIAKEGTGTEWGWATASGQTRAAATTGYSEGTATAAGTDFASRLKGAQAPDMNVPGYVPAKYVPWVKTASMNTGMAASIVAAQINDESGFNPNATSSAGAEGIAQFEPGTFKTYGKGSPYNAQDALGAYSKYMSSLLKQYNGNVRNALAAYNAGPGNLQAGYGYADSILAAAGAPRTATAGGASSYGGTRPGGQPAGQTDDGAAVTQLFTDYENEVTLPRTAPASTFSPGNGLGAPFAWWWQSFTGQYATETGDNSGG